MTMVPDRRQARPRNSRRRAWFLVLVAASACAPEGPGCTPLGDPIPLPDDLSETSGLAVSLAHADTYWTHNDAGSLLFAVDGQGSILGRFPLSRHARDWEDVALSTCPGGGSCLYMMDLGDNYEERTDIRILRAREPDPNHSDTVQVEAFPVVLPDGPRDIEALIVLPGERILVVTKGRNDPITVYRYPPPLRPDTVMLEEVQRLSERPRIFPRQLTGGAAAPRGGLVALRTYGSLQFYALDADTLVPVEGGLVDLRALREPQGEAVGIGLDGQVVLTSEGGPGGGPGYMSKLRCRFEGL